MDPDPVDPTLLFNNIRTNKNNGSVETYHPVEYHWFFKIETGNEEEVWLPFSKKDSKALEENHIAGNNEAVVPTDGGRFDVIIKERTKVPVYWSGKPLDVRRCSWFFKGSAVATYQPYDEDVAAYLEKEYASCFEKNEWHKSVELPNGDKIVMHSNDVIVLFPPSVLTDDWGNSQTQVRPRVVRRGVEEFDIDEGEPEKVDHVLFIVHGIGSVCDLKFRSVQEVVDDFRNISLQLVRAHYQSSYENGIANRIEVLPISWHNKLHSDETGIDETLKSITLDSMPKLRCFTNNTLLDILFYTSPKYCQRIISSVSNELNNLYEKFKKRNPTFNGHVSLGGHSLGSLILFDLLAHQQSPEQGSTSTTEQTSTKPDRRISHMYGVMGAEIPRINYPQLLFQPTALFAMGSPIGMFITVRGLDSLGEDYVLPTCSNFFNIFHPNDPVAYRIESLVNPKLASLKPMLVPHHKGRKRMHLELKETMVRVGADLKHKVLNSVKQTWNTLFHLGIIPVQANSLEENGEYKSDEGTNHSSDDHSDNNNINESLGRLNNGRRIDYVLQESPFDILNEYVSAITSHLCYWESEDTILFILKEIYATIQVKPDNQIPQATMTIERPLDSSGSRRGSAV